MTHKHLFWIVGAGALIGGAYLIYNKQTAAKAKAAAQPSGSACFTGGKRFYNIAAPLHPNVKTTSGTAQGTNTYCKDLMNQYNSALAAYDALSASERHWSNPIAAAIFNTIQNTRAEINSKCGGNIMPISMMPM